MVTGCIHVGDALAGPRSIGNGVAHGQCRRIKPFPDFPTRQKFRNAMASNRKCLERGSWPGKWLVSSRTPESYRQFIQGSRAEFSVPKNGYVKMRGGWFSDRSVCYLASGRPVLIEDTGLTDWLPVGEGVVTFANLEEARAGIDRINADYAAHRRAARRIAEEHFGTEKVLARLIHEAMG
jgi:hypothetical protein